MGNLNLTTVNKIPNNPKKGSTFVIQCNGITNYTHSIFKYPCKFIPQIPEWFINKYKSNKTEQYGLIDPFMGSGTALVEASVAKIPSYGIDVDPLGILLSKVKTTTLTNKELRIIKTFYNNFNKNFNKTNKKQIENYIPSLSNLDHWFSKKAILDLATIKFLIYQNYKINKNKKIKNFLLITFASIIRKVSFADEQSPKPYVSTKIKKIPSDVKQAFLYHLCKNIKSITKYSKKVKNTNVKIIGWDARKINNKEILAKKIHLAITSPPYINAFDYVRSLKLENYWIDSFDEKNLSIYYKKQIGTEKISSKQYKSSLPKFGIKVLDDSLKKIYKVDQKRAHVINDFFISMSKNLKEIYKILLKDGYYCIVIGDSKIRNIEISSSKILKFIAKDIGFKLENEFSYIIRNRYLRIPRKGKGGLVTTDNIIIFKK